MTARPLRPPGLPSLGVYTPGLEVTGGRLVFVSGQVPVDAEGRTVGTGDPAAQTRQVIENIRAVLREAGGDLRDIVKVTVFTTDMAHRSAVNRVREELFGAHRPCSSQVQVVRLVDPDWLVEIEAVAVVE